MRKKFGLPVAIMVPIVLTTLLQLESCAQTTANAVGNWNLTVETERGKQSVLLVLNQQGDKLTGLLKSLDGNREFDNVALGGSIKGKKINFEMSSKDKEKAAPIIYSGTVEKDSMHGEVDFQGRGKGKWTAVRNRDQADSGGSSNADQTKVDATVNVTGVWKFVVETIGGIGKPTFNLKQEGETLTGTYKGPLGEADVAGNVKDGKATFHIDVNVNGQDVRVTYKAKILDQNSMKGTVQFGDNLEGGEGTWTGKRQ